jgi:transcriptional regulator with XRE-family HTH domain
MPPERTFFNTLGNKIKEIRLKAGLSIEYFSETTNISVEDLLEIESGSKSITLEDLVDISNSLKINPSSLLP